MLLSKVICSFQAASPLLVPRELTELQRLKAISIYVSVPLFLLLPVPAEIKEVEISLYLPQLHLPVTALGILQNANCLA